jgi:phosphopantothenoylcysteine synthetase/decarboxylase
MGIRIVGPTEGRLACGTKGLGRMAEPQDILEAIEKIASEIKKA